MIHIANPDIGEEEYQQVSEVFDSGMLADGQIVREFEDEFASFCGTDYAVATSNGTTALHTAFEALGIGDGDRVVTTPFSFIASANAIRLAGAEPVFADIDPETYNLDPESVEKTILEHDGDVDAILAVHLYGLPADMERLAEITENYDILLVEDAAQSHGATVNGGKVGSFGDAACFSFYPTKNMTTGEGGMITTDKGALADRAKRFINHGRSESRKGYAHVEIGHNFRMTNIAAAIGRVQLEKLPGFIQDRRENAARLTAGLQETSVTTPVEPDGQKHVYHQYSIQYKDREGLQSHLEEKGVGYGVYYPTPIHEQPPYEDMSASAPISERVARKVLSIPVHPKLDDGDVNKIIKVINDYVV